MFCSNCGTKLSGGKFCPSCGHAVVSGNNTPQQYSERLQYPPPRQNSQPPQYFPQLGNTGGFNSPYDEPKSADENLEGGVLRKVKSSIVFLVLAVILAVAFFMPLFKLNYSGSDYGDYGYDTGGVIDQVIGRMFSFTGWDACAGKSFYGVNITYGNIPAFLLLLIPAALFAMFKLSGKFDFISGKRFMAAIILCIAGVITLFVVKGELLKDILSFSFLQEEDIAESFSIKFTAWGYAAIVLYSVCGALGLYSVSTLKKL